MNRVGEVYVWTMDDDVIVVVAKRYVTSRMTHEWECRSLLTAKPCWITESFFHDDSRYLRRVA